MSDITLCRESSGSKGGSGPVPTVAPAPPPRGTSSLSSGHHLQAGAAVVALASVNSSTGSTGNSLGGGGGVSGAIGSNHATVTTSTAATSNSTKHANMHRLKHTSSVAWFWSPIKPSREATEKGEFDGKIAADLVSSRDL
uniref:Uncharacterized protein n=1 Tax=Anopheles culicifacies TaxID=139723 RepID=A0A182LRV1_9DIPT